jgi:hypothetical protein
MYFLKKPFVLVVSVFVVGSVWHVRGMLEQPIPKEQKKISPEVLKILSCINTKEELRAAIKEAKKKEVNPTMSERTLMIETARALDYQIFDSIRSWLWHD